MPSSNLAKLSHEALEHGGVLLALPWSTREELRVTCRIDNGERTYDARVWFLADGEWVPTRRGWNGLHGKALRSLGVAFTMAGEAAPRIGNGMSKRARARRARGENA